MAEQRLGRMADLDLREAEEIERLLKEEEQKAGRKSRWFLPDWFREPKWLLVIGGSLLAMVVMGWGLYQGLLKVEETPTVPPLEVQGEKDSIDPFVQVQKPNMYPLQPFFVPLRHKNRETGKFLHVTAHLMLSNRRLHKDIDKVQPLIRQSVYSLLSNKNPSNFIKGRIPVTEEKIKREILTVSNSLLLSGAGTVTNVVFTEFIVSPS